MKTSVFKVSDGSAFLQQTKKQNNKKEIIFSLRREQLELGNCTYETQMYSFSFFGTKMEQK